MKKSTFYLRAGSLQRKYQKTLFFKGYIHLEWTISANSIDKYLCIPKQ